MKALAVDKLSKTFNSDFYVRKIPAVREVSFDIEEGETFGFVGHNGAGKTTTIKMLVGLIYPTSGRAEIFGRPLGDASTRQKIGFLPERPYFYEYLTAVEALNYYGALHGMKKAELKPRVGELLALMDLSDAAERPMKGYSKGMLQRFGMAAALIHDPAMVILDEPMSGLDPLGRGQIKEIIADLKRRGKTIFFSSHILSDVEQLCDRVALIAHGRIEVQGKVSELTRLYADNGYEIILGEELPPQTVEKFTAAGVAPDKIQDGFRVRVPREKKNEIMEMVRVCGGEILSMGPTRVSLEDVFLRGYGKPDKGSDKGSDKGLKPLASLVDGGSK